MSFVDQEDIIQMGEEMLSKVVKDVKGIDIQTPFPRMTYDEAMKRYGSDKPDTFWHGIARCVPIRKRNGFQSV